MIEKSEVLAASPMQSDSQLRSRKSLETALERLRAGDRASLERWLLGHLLEQVLPFWERFGFASKGGLSTCVADDGRLLSGDKWLWSQWRAVWVYSRLYNRIERNELWLKRALDLADFCVRTGWEGARSSWRLVVDEDGGVLRGCESTYVDAFAVYGLAELLRAGRDRSMEKLARATADAALKTLEGRYDRIPHFPYPIPENAKPHGIPMLWSLALAELGDALSEPRYLEASRRLTREIMDDFHRRERDLVLEFVGLDGNEFAGPQGTAVVPGHVIEDMWFQIRNARLAGGSVRQDGEYLRILLKHLELGWDEAGGGGLLLAVDAEGRRPAAWNFADAKLWWPHTEALYGALLGWTLTGSEDCLDWYRKIWILCLGHFVDWEHGEWRQRLDRGLRPLAEVVALPVKDPFHLPRSLILQIEALRHGL